MYMHSANYRQRQYGNINVNNGNNNYVPIRTLYFAPIKPNVGYFLCKLKNGLFYFV